MEIHGSLAGFVKGACVARRWGDGDVGRSELLIIKESDWQSCLAFQTTH